VVVRQSEVPAKLEDLGIRFADKNICGPAVWGESHSRAEHGEETVVCVGGVVVARGAVRVVWCASSGSERVVM
jgi:hypothetical protein